MNEPIHIISLGAGVQSSTMALMAAAGEITPMPVAAIFVNWRYPLPDARSSAIVLGMVAAAFGFSKARLRRQDRHQRVNWARQVAITLLMELTPCTTARASQLIGRDHSTVHYARHRVADLIATDRHLAAEIQRLKASIQAKLEASRTCQRIR